MLPDGTAYHLRPVRRCQVVTAPISISQSLRVVVGIVVKPGKECVSSPLIPKLPPSWKVLTLHPLLHRSKRVIACEAFWRSRITGRLANTGTTSWGSVSYCGLDLFPVRLPSTEIHVFASLECVGARRDGSPVQMARCETLSISPPGICCSGPFSSLSARMQLRPELLRDASQTSTVVVF